MKFYGLTECTKNWKVIIETELGITCGEVIAEPDRLSVSSSFTAELSKADLDFLQDNYWYKVEEGQSSPWNHRIAFGE
jgi:hypothetical protein